MDYKFQKKERSYTSNFCNNEMQQGTQIQKNKDMPQAHKLNQDPKRTLHGTGFYGCNAAVQGRQASKSAAAT